MAPDLGLVAHAAQGDPHERAARGRGPPTRRARSCPPRAGRPGPGWRPSRGRRPGPGPLGLELAHGQVLEDALLHVVQPVVVLVEDPRRPRRRRGCPRTRRPRGARGPCRSRSGSTRARGSARSCARACRPRGATAVRTASGRSRSVDLGAVAVGRPVVGVAVSSPSSLRMASSWRRSRNSRWVFSMPSSTSVLICSRSARSARVSRAQPSTSAQPRLDVDGLEDLDLLRQAQVGRVAGQVGDRRRLGHVAQPLRHAAGAPAEQDVLEHGPVLAGQLDRPSGVLGSSATGSASTHRALAGPGHAGADGRPARSPLTTMARQAPGQLALLDDLGDHADRGVAAVDVGHEQQPAPRPAAPPPRPPWPRRTPGPW